MGQWAAPCFSDERDAFIRGLILGSDALLLGRTTYDIQAWYWPNQKGDKYGIANHKNSMPKYVVTSRPLQVQWDHSTLIEHHMLEEITRLKQLPGKDILIEGSATLVQSLARAGLIDEYQLLVHPSMMGSGKRFFNEGMSPTQLRLVESKPLPRGVVALSYEPIRD
jgi:dihydrofolate reductase